MFSLGSRLFLALAIASFTLTGCTFTRSRINDSGLGTKIDSAVSAGSIQVGSSTIDDISQALGSAPNSILAAPGGGRVLVYTFGQSKTKGFTFIILNILKTNVGLDTAVFLMDSNGKLKEHYTSSNSEDLPWEWWAFGG